ncbi:hypothetical protein C8J56DRAFT_881206 [Mycena floridula]|nr:hypothetical protein C8J56DRAFT_881206 [Mycena floridula]
MTRLARMSAQQFTYYPSTSPGMTHHQLHLPVVNPPYPFMLAIEPPRMARTICIPLPPARLSPPPISYLYPFDLTLEINPYILDQLSGTVIPASTRIYIHDTETHVGDIQLHQGQFTAADIIRYAQNIACGPLSSTMYHHQLCDEMKHRIRNAFVSRYPGIDGLRAWEAFSRGQGANGSGPSGRDLLLGKTKVWGLNPDPVSWKWILYVA